MANGTGPQQQREIAQLARKVGPQLERLHHCAHVLQGDLERMQASSRQWEHYLLQPAFAQDAAQQLGGSFERPFSLAGALYSALEHTDLTGGDARGTLQIPGVLAVPENVISAAAELNRAKESFAGAVSAFRHAVEDRPAPERDRRLRDLFAEVGHPRTHLRQCYRQVLLCPTHPDAIALSWIKARKSIRKVTVSWCDRKLVAMDPQGADPGIQYQRQLLANLPRNRHDDLRQVQVQSRPNLQVAEIFREDVNGQGSSDGSAGESYRQVGYAAMPVLVRSDAAGRLPDFSRVDHEPGAGRRRQRRDLALPREPFLAALRVHLRGGS
ncbi:hypothetical protein [Microbulbifer zhoushanensis]|uniref:hypothetical protein n=1 Tax=Microbulbifer zhoushanensis TaxID=2904254 RepID=UPI001F44CC79|nr:hypothetical protein [Microbulbifer zhoushanensis]